MAVRDYFAIDLALSTGLRVMEIANLKHGDVFIPDGLCSLVIRNGAYSGQSSRGATL